VSCRPDDFEQLTGRFKARAAWPPASRIDVLLDLERLCDLRKIGFLLQVLADPAENDAVRIHALRWFRCGNCAPSERRRVAEAIRWIAANRVNPGVRVNAVLALAEFADLEDVQAALGSVVLDGDEPLDLRYCALRPWRRQD
jgi:hypothetical protein